MIGIKIVGENQWIGYELRQGLYIEDSPQADLQLFNISGLNPPPAAINTEAAIGQAGSILQGVQLQERTVNISFTCPKDRRLIYAELVPGELVKVEIYGENNYTHALDDGQYNHLNLYGYVETVEIDYFSEKVVCIVQLRCPDPYLYVATGLTSYRGLYNEQEYEQTSFGSFTGGSEAHQTIRTPFATTPLNLSITPNSAATRVVVRYTPLESGNLSILGALTRAVDIRKTGLGALGTITISSEQGKKNIKAGNTSLLDSIVYPIEFPVIRGHSLGSIEGWHNDVSVTAYNSSGAEVSCEWSAWIYNRVLGV